MCTALPSESDKVEAARSKIRVSLEDLVSSLEELSRSLQRVTSSLSHTLSSLDSEIASSNLPSIEKQYMQQGSFGRRAQSDLPNQFSGEGLPEAEERNAVVSKVAFKLQQAFVQARVDFLGKPFQLALEEFVDCTMRVYALGVDLLTLQLQLVLAERAYYGKDLAEDVQEMVTQEGHVRAMWIRLAYITLNHAAEVKAAKEGDQSAADIRIDPQEDLGGQGQFVKSVIKMHLEQGLTLDRLKLEQAYAEKTDSPAIEALQQSHYLILMTLAKALGEYE
ncbi:hypothetical protein KFL_000290480 [Klebsormidium nitens]|uniref:Uncharacterized protein n=1 Tax=Klebsormidium nitens TaxID=105231 RepID=A0A1Y1HU77_KLENI|nr:hypothetical protein KFL_000290480 [Klebsormidium nitens]|eukprot:GAQ79398.1 hypothetical protein KFL_000290480 [Klebsormidium nitens]